MENLIEYKTITLEEERDQKFEDFLASNNNRPLKFNGIMTISDVVNKLYDFAKDIADNQRINKEKANSEHCKNWVMDILCESMDSTYSKEAKIPTKLSSMFDTIGLKIDDSSFGYIQPMGLWFQPVLKGNKISEIKIFIEDGLHRKVYITTFFMNETVITKKDIKGLQDLDKREKLLKLCEICGGTIKYENLPSKLLDSFHNMRFVVNVCYTTDEEEGAKMFAYMNAGVPVNAYDRLKNLYCTTHVWKAINEIISAFTKTGTKFFFAGKEFTQKQASNIAFLMPVQIGTKTFKILRDILAVGNYRDYNDDYNWEDPITQGAMFTNLFARYRNNDEAFDKDFLKTLDCLNFIGSIVKNNPYFSSEGQIKARPSITTGMIFAMMKNSSVNHRNIKKVQIAFDNTVRDFEEGKISVVKHGKYAATVRLDYFSNSHYRKAVPMLFAKSFLERFEEVI